MEVNNEEQKKRVNVGFATAKPPQTHSTSILPKKGTALNKLVMTVAPQ